MTPKSKSQAKRFAAQRGDAPERTLSERIREKAKESKYLSVMEYLHWLATEVAALEQERDKTYGRCVQCDSVMLGHCPKCDRAAHRSQEGGTMKRVKFPKEDW